MGQWADGGAVQRNRRSTRVVCQPRAGHRPEPHQKGLSLFSTTSSSLQYVKLVFPHVALVAVVCLYAVIGAYIFYRLESPNEDWLKQQGKESIGKMRSRLIGLIKEGEMAPLLTGGEGIL